MASTPGFDAVSWARTLVGEPGAPAQPEPLGGEHGSVEIDETSRVAISDPTLRATVVEEHAARHGLTIGLFPERYETAPIATLVRDDDPGAGASGPGFASRTLPGDPDRVVVMLEPRPEAQAGRGLVLPTLVDAVDLMRLLAQSATATQIMLAADTDAARLWLAVLDDPDQTTTRLRDGQALVILIAAARHGQAAAITSRAVATAAQLGATDAGQNIARAFAAGRYRLAAAARRLAPAGYTLTTTWQMRRWSSLTSLLGEPPGAGRVGIEVCGATAHTATCIDRTLAADSDR